MHKRRYVRVKVQAPFVIRGIGSSRSILHRGQGHNLSEGGMGGVVSGEWLPGQIVAMELILPVSGESLQLNARVRHRASPSCGFEFLGPESAVAEKIREVCLSAAAGTL